MSEAVQIPHVEDAARSRWVPPQRPEWVARLNAEGEHFDLRSVVPLDEQSLIRAATANTGLDDFGEEGWHEPFQVLVKALDEEAQLNLMGRLMTRSDLVIMLESRLQIEATYRRHPEIDDEQIVKPLIIVGQGRSGTTMLHALLAEDPASGTVRTWEAVFPCPPPEAATYKTDRRIARADALTTQWARVAPEVEAMHQFNGRVPTESIQVHCLAFRSTSWLSLLGQVPSYSAYMETRDPAEAFRYEKRVMKLLQWRNPRRTWVMKAPYILHHMPTVLEVFPDAGFIWPHRDPVKALASVVNLVGTLYWMRSDHPFAGDSLAYHTDADIVADMMAQPISWLENGQVPREQLHDVQYRDLVKDPMSEVARIYDAFGLELTDAGRAAMQAYLDQHPRSGHPAHTYDVGSKEEIALKRKAFQAYQEYFDVPNEIG